MKKQSTNIQREGFKTPDNYFENFQQKLNTKLDLENKNNRAIKVVSLWSTKLKYVTYIAASVLLLIGITFSFKDNKSTKNQITLVTDTVNTVKKNIQFDFLNYDDDDELLALFIEDDYVDDYLDDYLIEGVILQN